MKYIIMADGKERRWGNYQGIHKWQIRIGDQTILERTCKLLQQMDPEADIYITSHDSTLNIPGTIRHEPQNNVLEIDRFTAELIQPDICFLYGDSYYAEEALQQIMETKTDGVLCFGTERKIFAVKVSDAELFRAHIARVRKLYLEEKIHECIGWEVYHSLQGLPLESREIGGGYVMISDDTCDFNSPQDLKDYQAKRGSL